MTIIGDSSRFSVEYTLDENYGGEWMFGRLCFWCDGQRIGDYDLGTSLRDALFYFEELGKYHDLRINKRFDDMDAEDVFHLIDSALFGKDYAKHSQLVEEEKWAQHYIFPALDVFNNWKGFLIEGAQRARLIFACDPYSKVKEFFLSPGEVDGIFKIATSKLNAIYEGELGIK